MFYAVIYGIAGVGLIWSWYKDRKKSKQALRNAGKMALKMVPGLLSIVLFIGILLALLTPQIISHYLGPETGIWASAAGAIIGAVAMFPSIMAFPLAGSFYQSGASIGVVSVFISTLVMVGFVTAPAEIQQLGKRLTLLRNGLSFLAAVVIAFIMGVIL